MRPKKAKGERKRNTENKQKMAFSRENKFFFVLNNQKTKQKTKNKKQNKTATKTNKEGFGPSEVALWATSPDL